VAGYHVLKCRGEYRNKLFRTLNSLLAEGCDIRNNHMKHKSFVKRKDIKRSAGFMIVERNCWKNRNLEVVAKTPKLTYSEAVRVSRAVHSQNELTSEGQTPDGEALERCRPHAPVSIN